MNMRFALIASLFAGLMASTAAQSAQQAITDAIVTRVLYAPTPDPTNNNAPLYGGCMAKLELPLGTPAPIANCLAGWVAFSCDGTYNPKDAALLMFDQAQLAFAQNTTKKVYVTVDDAKKHNGYCTAIRFDVKN